MNFKDWQKKILFRAIRDKNFRNELKKNPKKVIEKELNQKIPSNIQIEIIEQPENKWLLVLPNVTDAEALSDADLANIAGGVAAAWVNWKWEGQADADEQKEDIY